MPSLSELPDNLKREKLTKVLEYFGFIISTKGGKGSHIKATCEKTQKSIILPAKLSRNTLYYIIKEIEKYSEVKWTDIKDRL